MPQSTCALEMEKSRTPPCKYKPQVMNKSWNAQLIQYPCLWPWPHTLQLLQVSGCALEMEKSRTPPLQMDLKVRSGPGYEWHSCCKMTCLWLWPHTVQLTGVSVVPQW